MLLSYRWYKKYKDSCKRKEYFVSGNGSDNNTGGTIFFLGFAIVHFFLFILAMFLAIRCGNRPDHSMLVHVLVAFFFPEIYLIYYLIARCKPKPPQQVVVVGGSSTTQPQQESLVQ